MFNQTKPLLSLAFVAAMSASVANAAADTSVPAALKIAGLSPAHEKKIKAATEAFEKSDFEEAYKLFSELFDLKTDDARINFYLGRSSLETKRYEEALSAFERVLIVEPTHIRSRLEMARAYFELKEFDAAEAEFDKALEADLPKKVREQILSYKKAITAAKKKHFVNGYLMAGIGWDSNIKNSMGAEEFMISSPSKMSLPGEKEKSDYYHTQVFGLNHIWNMSSLVADGFFWQNSFTAYAQSYPKNSASSARYLGLNTGPGYRTKKYEVSLSLASEYLIYNAASPYMRSYYVTPKLSYKLTDVLISEGSYTYKDKRYTKENKDRDSSYQEFYLGLKKLFPQSGSIVTVGTTFAKEKEKNTATNSGRTDISNNSQRYSVSLYRPVIEGLDMSAGLSYNCTQYDEMDVNFLKQSKDFALVYSLGVMKSLTKSSMITLNGTYTDNKSNIDNKVYNKKSVNLNYIYNF